MPKQTRTLAIGAILGMKNLGESPLDMVQAVRRGLPYQSLAKVAEALDLSTNQLAQYLPVTARTLQRYQKEKQKLDRDLSDHLLQIARVFARCREVMEDGDRARRWLQTPSLPLGQVTPLSLLDTFTGVEMVMDELGRIEHGLVA
ncbi:type II RES/Xre toxin-antitoxin system antitoxin [Geoalkalibacter sp.]|uniref:type II RES/Xre toxin-antitoxin system antitoxin n=1 Tax=Geoalkalibacter sp. TaxID=3041440 RepID=UPI00272E8A91|nr:antitoxin Xre/MbcA/ParS toxin-binding domain-containing protein [Geoalkalibacter sp.]